VLLTALLMGADAARAQSPPNEAGGTLTGKLTDLRSAPLDGATVVLRNQLTGAEARAITPRNGSFRFTGLEPGEYSLEAESARLGRGRLEGVVVSAGHEARVQAAMAFEAVAEPLTVAAHATAPANAPPPSDQPHNLALPGLKALRPAEEKSISATAVVVESLPAEALHEMTPSGRALQSEARVAPTTEPQMLIATVANEPLQMLSQNGHEQLESVGSDVGGIGALAGQNARSGMAVSEAVASAVQAAMSSAQPAARHAQAAADQVDPLSPVVSTTVTAPELQSLPAAGRRWQDFVLDTPTATTAAGGTQGITLRGAGQEPAESSIDGASTRMAFGGPGNSGSDSQGPGTNGRGGSDQNAIGPAWAGGHGSPVTEGCGDGEQCSWHARDAQPLGYPEDTRGDDSQMEAGDDQHVEGAGALKSDAQGVGQVSAVSGDHGGNHHGVVRRETQRRGQAAHGRWQSQQSCG